jgi:hypothetical protein
MPLLDLRSLWELYAHSDADSTAIADAVIQIALQGADATAVADAVALLALTDADVGSILDAALRTALNDVDAVGTSDQATQLSLATATDSVFAVDAVLSLTILAADSVAATDGGEVVNPVGVRVPTFASGGPPYRVPKRHTYVIPRHDSEALLALLALGEIDEDELAALEAEQPDLLVVAR